MEERPTELRLERMVHGGAALARLEGGRVGLVRGGIPGELVTARLEPHSGVLQGFVEEVLEPSPDRLPETAHPGLDFGHIRYPRQLELKREVVRDALARAGAAEGAVQAVQAVRSAPAIWRYRSAVQPAVTPFGLGYREPRSRRVRELEDDPVANPSISGAWRLLQRERPPKGVREIAARGNDRGEVLLALVATAAARLLLDYAHGLVAAGVTGVAYARFDPRGRFRSGSERLAGGRWLLQRYGDFDVTVSATSFAQPNPGAAGGLYRELAALAGQGRRALELFAGSGVISLHLAAAFEEVEAVEIDRGSVERGRRDAARLGIDNIAFLRGDARRAAAAPGVELIAVDPPRAGLGREVRDLLDGSSADRVLYVSCDPATWARDVSELIGRGWRLTVAQPFDFYPHTHHVEMLSLLQR